MHNFSTSLFSRPAALLLLSLVMQPPVSAETQPRSPNVGTIAGLVTYRDDAQRRWRYARYYVKDRRQGFLAEAVVALHRRGLVHTRQEPPQTRNMDQQDFQFVPETLAIRAGDSVRFTSRDAETHNVRASGRLATFSENMPRGGQYVHAFPRGGGIRSPVKISCVYHGAMRAWIFVFDHPYFQVTEADGRFHLTDVPAGKYTLEMYHPAGQLRWKQPVDLQAGQQQTIAIPVSPDNKTRGGR